MKSNRLIFKYEQFAARLTMKIFCAIVLCSVLVAVNAKFSKEEAMEAVKGLSQQCKVEVGATDADVASILNHDPSTTHEAKCLRECMMKKFELISADGKLNVAKIVKMAEMFTDGDAAKMAASQEIGEKCANAADGQTDPCEAAFLFNKCAKDELKARNLDIGCV